MQQSTPQRTKSGILALIGSLALLVPAANAADIAAGRSVYETASAVCHGQTGRPEPDNPVVSGLGEMPADFS